MLGTTIAPVARFVPTSRAESSHPPMIATSETKASGRKRRGFRSAPGWAKTPALEDACSVLGSTALPYAPTPRTDPISVRIRTRISDASALLITCAERGLGNGTATP